MAAAYEVQNVSEDQIDDPNGSGDLVDVFDISFTIPPKSNSFIVQVPQSGQPVTAAHDAIMAKVDAVNAIYAGI